MGEAGGRKSAGPPRTGRDLARQVLARVEQDGAFANRALAAALDRAGDMGAQDRALATELVYGVLRRRTRLDRALNAVAERGLTSLDPGMRILLRVGAYQILFLDRVPSYAAVNDTVEAAKRNHGQKLAGLANALLRRVAERGEPPLPDPARDAAGYLSDACGFPPWLARLALRELGAATALAVGEQMNVAAPLSMRANAAAGITVDALAQALAAERPDATLARSDVAPHALLGRGIDAPARTAAFERGLFSIQDLGAQVVAELCGARPGERILDACAGLGGKTSHLASLSGNGARIDALDLSQPKLDQAAVEWARLGVRGIDARVADLTHDFPDHAGPWDRVLLDAPCSGLGVLRRHPEALSRRSEADLTLLAQTQRRMLDVVSARVAAGGVLVYAVCTFDRVEAQDVVAAFLSGHPEFHLERPEPAVGGVPWDRLIDGDGFVRTWPHRDDADAFFAARFRRATTAPAR